ncbi:unnamed protein product [Ilex paraguariensis]|uniref:CSN8/PSMD8/EIF3K domain-containing protein n=1 Tax=Ilex paraguariensis TaxID=185542 RepID=A0ABC8RX54_9AQUA
MASKSYEKIADICDNLMLQVAAQGIAFQEEWPYEIHLLGHIYVNDINSARFLWKSIPAAIKESRPEVGAAWKIGQRLWTRDYERVHEAIREFNWSPAAHDLVVSFSGKFLRLPLNIPQGNPLKLLVLPLGAYIGFVDGLKEGYGVKGNENQGGLKRRTEEGELVF